MKDAHNKLSKRNGDASFMDLIEKGYIPEAILNYIALLGWSPRGNEEFYTLPELEKAFDIEGISKSPAIFDIEKLKWMNAEYLRRMTPEEFYNVALPYIDKALDGADFSEDVKLRIAGLIQPRTELLTDIEDKISFFAKLPEYSTELYCHKKMKTDTANSLTSLNIVLEALTNGNGANIEWTSASLYEFFCGLASENELKNSQILWPIRTALSGKDVSPGGATELAEILGKDESIKRIKVGIELLKG
jgi:glutamyl-tRNA synthetase